MIILSGGTGSPKLIDGLRQLIPDEEITVIVNTGEDIWSSEVFISPDVDTVLYLFAGILDKTKWWSIVGDTYNTFNQMKELGHNEILMLGDRDRAVNLVRTRLLKNGLSLTEATVEIAKQFGIKATVLPMSDETATSVIETPAGKIHFQEFWVSKKGEPEILSFEYEGIEKAKLSPAVKEILEKEDCVIIGPSNPMTSIGPILALPEMKEILKTKKVIAISPIIGNAPVSGPAGKLMAAKGLEVSSKGVVELYRDFVDIFVYDIRDEVINPAEIEAMGIQAVALDTMMTDEGKRKGLAEKVLELFNKG
ncbi:2-phospho-L-lactate transferase [Methanimicrococcus blatticola]|uniref:2-phospho-L-lactate transferase n=1 Tax=Methanimicrococcus blatticola TaxID=91560 RepID=A0A484F4P0_9EURY|nr:2-phospho-L-lactate transferase [Methanimicrococcus blatticola]MBZ3935708.1 2-phospho-L-lactate transferase [Methanimicrococcus blatticola]MCC2508171.1 2-phospho-L-lactate transferase [Methanimicrococcus blatticola]TDQ68752.1 LPPG:FO 2-phospho-L-lactate transferase [Methanimicrococcus blatticola]